MSPSASPITRKTHGDVPDDDPDGSGGARPRRAHLRRVTSGARSRLRLRREHADTAAMSGQRAFVFRADGTRRGVARPATARLAPASCPSRSIALGSSALRRVPSAASILITNRALTPPRASSHNGRVTNRSWASHERALVAAASNEFAAMSHCRSPSTRTMSTLSAGCSSVQAVRQPIDVGGAPRPSEMRRAQRLWRGEGRSKPAPPKSASASTNVPTSGRSSSATITRTDGSSTGNQTVPGVRNWRRGIDPAACCVR